MKKTLLAMLALTGLASGATTLTLIPESLLTNWSYDTVALYDFEGTTSTYLTNKSTSTNKSGGTWSTNAITLTQANGGITFGGDAGGQYSGLYNADVSLSGNWVISLQANPAAGSGTSRGLMQFGTQMALYIGNGNDDWGNLGLTFADGSKFALTTDTYTTGLHTYSLSYTGGTLKLWVDGTDITSQLTHIKGTGSKSTIADAFSNATGTVTLDKLGYANDFGPHGLAKDTTLNELAAYQLTAVKPAPGPTPGIPEPATATLSLLALCGLAARRRR